MERLFFVVAALVFVMFFNLLPLARGEVLSNCRFGNDLCKTDIKIDSIVIGSANLQDQIIDMKIGGISIDANHPFTAQIKTKDMPLENLTITNDSNGWYYGTLSNMESPYTPINQTVNFWPFTEYSFDVFVYIHENVQSLYTDSITTGFEKELTYQKIWQIDGMNDTNPEHNGTSTILHYVVNLHYTDNYKKYNFLLAVIFIVIPIILFLPHFCIRNLNAEKHTMIFLGSVAVMVFILFTIRQYITAGYSLNELIISAIILIYCSTFAVMIRRNKRVVGNIE